MTHKPAARDDVPVYLTPERLAIRDLAREFTAKEVLPVADRLDPERGDIPDGLRQKMADIGFFGIMVGEEHGGLGLGVFEYCLVAEELARGWLSVSGLLARGNGMCCGFTASRRPGCSPALRAASGWAPTHCPRRKPGPTSPTSRAGLFATGTNGS